MLTTHAADDASKKSAAQPEKDKLKTAPIEADNIAAESEQYHSTMKRDARIFASPIISEGLNTQIYTGSISENSISDGQNDNYNQDNEQEQEQQSYESHEEPLKTLYKKVSTIFIIGHCENGIPFFLFC